MHSKACSLLSRVHLCVIPWSVASFHKVLQARILDGLPFPSPGDLPNPGIEPGSPALQADSLLSKLTSSVQFSSLSLVRLFATPWTTAHQASRSITNSWSLLKLMSIMSAMPSNHLILCHPFLLLPSVFPRLKDWES